MIQGNFKRSIHRKINIVLGLILYMFGASPCPGFTREQFAAGDDELVWPTGLLAEALYGSLYGTSERGGANDCGAILKERPTGKYRR
ncbi:MAG: hypothetical protein JWN25_1238 [Verrucomicrobiales bacterium]|nr:hypothetical protein [Verrucomicrobiales bacterium]MDB6130823.1 hypothetical protein [Verrucomicrobiales bacterium]